MRNTLIFLIISAVLLSGCSNLRFPGVYRIDIPQGNFVTQDMLDQLEPGMSPEQVSYVLGAPTLDDPFTANAWYYLMTFRPGQGESISQSIVVHFSGGAYSHYDGGVADSMHERTQARDDRELQRRAEDRRDEAQENQAAETNAP